MLERVAGGFLSELIMLGAICGGIAGCSTSDSAPQTSQAVSLACPVSVVAGVGAPCAAEGEDCPVGYTCGSFVEQAHCVCTSGKFVCADATHQTVDKALGPQCVGNGKGNDEECPAIESAAPGKGCTTAGLLCSYLGPVCGAAPALIDQCQCVGAADGGLVFTCEPKHCSPSADAAPPDANAPDAGDAGDAGEDG
jgi:hypothetical protein